MITDQRPPRDDFAEMKVCTSWPPEEEERLEMLRQVRETAKKVALLYAMAWAWLIGSILGFMVKLILEVFK